MKLKRLILFLGAIILSQQSLAQLSVFACEPEWAALATEIGGDQVNVTSATTAMQDPHQIQARPSLIAKMRQADLLICSGAELEIGWLPVLLQKSGNPKVQSGSPGHFMATDYVEMLDKPAVADRSEGDIHMAGNPHIHTSPVNMLRVAAALTERLSALSPEHKTLFENNHQRFMQSFNKALAEWQPKIKALKDKKIVVYHNYWVYLENWLQLWKVAALEPKPGLPPTSGHLSELVSQMATNKADIILYATYNDSKPAEWLSGKTGIPMAAVPATVEDWKADNALLHWYETILDTLIKSMAKPVVNSGAPLRARPVASEDDV
jgi:zinc/manganese transport system substrate-binding protein